MRETGNSYNLYQSLFRSGELKDDVQSYQQFLRALPTDDAIQKQAIKRKQSILTVLKGSEEDWANWKWQLQNRIRDSRILGQILGLSELERRRIDKVSQLYRWAISPYYLSLIDEDYENSPIYRQAVPDIRELLPGGSLDPMNETLTSPAPCITRRYPDRLIINVTNQCAMYCRHCQRRRNIGEHDQHSCREDIAAAVNYVAKNKEIRDVLITGGDALLLSNQMLDGLLQQLYDIPHVEMIRIGTRTPVTLPQRINAELCDIIRKYPPIYINTQFNHPREITPDSKLACDRLIAAGAVLGNQAVLLRGINDSAHIMRQLCHKLLQIRVRPYYIFHAKDVQGTRHFQTTIQEGIKIMASLRGHTSGLAVPTYIVNAPGGLGKVPLMPNHIVHLQEDKVIVRTWEDKLVEIENPLQP
ncbi:MAG: KamA family radical SAM protein [Syntrophomonadaceae bacterium]